jgi:hypothetical protein
LTNFYRNGAGSVVTAEILKTARLSQKSSSVAHYVHNLQDQECVLIANLNPMANKWITTALNSLRSPSLGAAMRSERTTSGQQWQIATSMSSNPARPNKLKWRAAMHLTSMWGADSIAVAESKPRYFVRNQQRPPSVSRWNINLRRGWRHG